MTGMIIMLEEGGLVGDDDDQLIALGRVTGPFSCREEMDKGVSNHGQN